METLEDLKAIRDNATEGKTHVCIEGKEISYWNDDDCDCLAISGDGIYLSGMRSLSDIERIIELMELLKDITENEDLDDCRFLAVERVLK
ncbi:MAG TPA: hypothetical protein VIC51_12355 [Psychromonas sp.]